MARPSTKYEDIPPRFRKVWIKGNAETVQKKLDKPIEEFSFTTPLQRSNSDTHLPEGAENRASRSQSVGASGGESSSSRSLSAQQRRLKECDSLLSVGYGNPSGDSGFPERDKDSSSIPIAYSGPFSMQQIINSVVDTNVARSTPPASRSSSPFGRVKSRSRHRPSSHSRPATRTNSPSTNTRPSTPTPSGWIPLTSRHSLRRFDTRPWGPRHLEYDYNEARKEFQSAAYYALGQYGYVPPKGVAKFKAPGPAELPSMSDLRKVLEFAKACRRLDVADRLLEEAIARGELWENTPIPEEYLKFSLESLVPDEFCTSRPDNSAVQERSRSSVTLEEAAGLMKAATLARSSTPSISTSTSAPTSERGCDSIAVDDVRSSAGVSSFARMTLVDGQLASSASSSGLHANVTALGSTPMQTEATNVPVSISLETGHGLSTTGSSTPSSQLMRKRLLEEIETGDEPRQGNPKRTSSDTGSPSNVATRANSPAPTPAILQSVNQASIGRTQSDSTSGSGSGSGFGEDASARVSPPSSVSTSSSKVTQLDGTRGRVAGMRGRKRGAGNR